MAAFVVGIYLRTGSRTRYGGFCCWDILQNWDAQRYGGFCCWNILQNWDAHPVWRLLQLRHTLDLGLSHDMVGFVVQTYFRYGSRTQYGGFRFWDILQIWNAHPVWRLLQLGHICWLLQQTVVCLFFNDSTTSGSLWSQMTSQSKWVFIGCLITHHRVNGFLLDV